jgi:hypothetical protein
LHQGTASRNYQGRRRNISPALLFDPEKGAFPLDDGVIIIRGEEKHETPDGKTLE